MNSCLYEEGHEESEHSFYSNRDEEDEDMERGKRKVKL